MTETELSRQIQGYLNFKGILFLRLNAGDRIVGTGNKRYRIRGVRAGCSDLLVLVHDRAIFIELKVDKNKQSSDQIVFEMTIKNLGHEYYVVRDLETLIEILEVV